MAAERDTLPRFTRQQRIALALVPRIAALLIRAIGSTLRFEDRPAPGVVPGDQVAGAGVYVFWHRALLLAAWRYRNLGIAILISASFDGELIARTVERLGFVAIRGSSSRGGAAAIIAMVRAFERGHKVAITADGPRGPIYVAKPGAAAVAARCGAPVGAFYLHAERAWTLASWDRFVIPKPFSRVRVGWTETSFINRERPVDISTEAVQAALNTAVALAEGYSASPPA